MNKLIKTMDIIGAVQLDLEKNYSDGQFELLIPFRFDDAEVQGLIYKWFNDIAKKNGWKIADYGKSSASFKISYSNDTFGKPEITYEVFVFATPRYPEDEKPTDDPTYIFTANLTDADKMVFKKLLIEHITNQIMEG